MDGVKKNNTLVYVAVGIAALLIITGIVMLVLGGSGSKQFYGDWECEDEVTINIDKDNFNMKYKALKVNIEATYNLKKEEEDQSYNKFTLNISATKREIGDEVYTDEYKTQYQIVMDSKDDDTMAMANTTSNSVYKCTRKA